MSKNEIEKKDQTATAIVSYDYKEDAGEGIKDLGQEFFQLPFLNLLQALSPQVAGDESEQIEGARPGMFFNSVSQELFDGKTGVILQPVHVRNAYVEWADRENGGGKVGEHLPESPLVTAAKERARTGKTDWNDLRTEADTILAETFYLLALQYTSLDDLAPAPVLLSFTSTKIKPFKNLMTRLATMQGGKVPLYANRIKMLSISDRNAAGQPFHNVKFVPGDSAASFANTLLAPNDERFAAGKKLRSMAAQVKVPVPSQREANPPF